MTTWTAERDALLTKLWADGLSCSSIANKIGGVSKNAVIGRAGRINLPKRRSGWPQGKASPTRVRSAAAAARASAIKPLALLGGSRMSGPPTNAAPPPPLPEDAAAYDDARRSELVHLIDLEPHHCRFAIGYDDRLGHGFCGCNAVPGMFYCEHHARRVYQPIERAWPSQRGDLRRPASPNTYEATAQEFLEPA